MKSRLAAAFVQCSFMLCAVALSSGALDAAECREQTHAGIDYRVCEADMSADQLRLFLARDNGVAYGHFTPINTALENEGLKLAFAMNAGMYHDDRAPVGLYVEDGKQVQNLILSDGPGNFGLLPNGVFCLREGRAYVVESRAFAKRDLKCTYATQSGPMLVIDGALHPRFLIDSTSRFIRNGVGVSDDGQRVVFAIWPVVGAVVPIE